MLMNDTNLSKGCIFVVDRAVKRWYFQILGAVFSMYLENVRVVIHLAALGLWLGGWPGFLIFISIRLLKG